MKLPDTLTKNLEETIREILKVADDTNARSTHNLRAEMRGFADELQEILNDHK